jgi:hypothetical protein
VQRWHLQGQARRLLLLLPPGLALPVLCRCRANLQE